jgi:hypothetical protein
MQGAVSREGAGSVRRPPLPGFDIADCDLNPELPLA